MTRDSNKETYKQIFFSFFVGKSDEEVERISFLLNEKKGGNNIGGICFLFLQGMKRLNKNDHVSAEIKQTMWW